MSAPEPREQPFHEPPPLPAPQQVESPTGAMLKIADLIENHLVRVKNENERLVLELAKLMAERQEFADAVGKLVELLEIYDPNAYVKQRKKIKELLAKV